MRAATGKEAPVGHYTDPYKLAAALYPRPDFPIGPDLRTLLEIAQQGGGIIVEALRVVSTVDGRTPNTGGFMEGLRIMLAVVAAPHNPALAKNLCPLPNFPVDPDLETLLSLATEGREKILGTLGVMDTTDGLTPNIGGFMEGLEMMLAVVAAPQVK